MINLCHVIVHGGIYKGWTMTPLPLTIIHLLGFTFGLGLATIVDVMLIRSLLRNQSLTEIQYKMIHQLSIYVMIGLGVLWLSGAGFLLTYKLYSPEKLCNPKVWAKFTIVIILTINGFFIHRYLLPKLKLCIGHQLMDSQSYRQLSVFCASGVLSIVSWYIPFILGVASQLNYRFGYFLLLFVYFCVLAFAIVTALSVLGFLYGNRHGPQGSIESL